jgi:hypothetical protein
MDPLISHPRLVILLAMTFSMVTVPSPENNVKFPPEHFAGVLIELAQAVIGSARIENNTARISSPVTNRWLVVDRWVGMVILL